MLVCSNEKSLWHIMKLFKIRLYDIGKCSQWNMKPKKKAEYKYMYVISIWYKNCSGKFILMNVKTNYRDRNTQKEKHSDLNSDFYWIRKLWVIFISSLQYVAFSWFPNQACITFYNLETTKNEVLNLR